MKSLFSRMFGQSNLEHLSDIKFKTDVRRPPGVMKPAASWSDEAHQALRGLKEGEHLTVKMVGGRIWMVPPPVGIVRPPGWENVKGTMPVLPPAFPGGPSPAARETQRYKDALDDIARILERTHERPWTILCQLRDIARAALAGRSYSRPDSS